ncbi:MAG: hypothetical protein WD688_20595 [Candidatus Binatia bacterium]
MNSPPQKSIHEARGGTACCAYGGTFTGSTDHCTARTTCGSANSSAACRTYGCAFRGVLPRLASRYRPTHAFVDVPFGHAGSNAHQMFI